MKDTILILHGWGINGEKYKELAEHFKKAGHTVFLPDFPGFGKEPLKKPAMNVDDYVQFVYDFLKKNKIIKPIVIGHSFGGRVGIKFAEKYPLLLKGLILSGAPGIKHPLPPHKKIITSLVKMVKNVPFVPGLESIARKGTYRLLGEWDYYKAGNMKETFKKVIAEDLSPFLSKISVPTLLLWGSHDTFVSLSDAKTMLSRIPKSSLSLIEKGSHRIPYENASEFFHKAKEFIGKL